MWARRLVQPARAAAAARWLRLQARGAPEVVTRAPGPHAAQLTALAQSALGAPGWRELLAACDEGVEVQRFAAAPPDAGEYVVYRTYVGDTEVGACFAPGAATALAECSDGHWEAVPPAPPALAACLNEAKPSTSS